MLKKILKDKRMLSLYIIVIFSLTLGFTYALSSTSLAINIGTGLVRIDEEAYGSTTFDSSDIDLIPILDSDVETSLDNVIKIDFTVGGASTNTANNIIYDIALTDFEVDCNLLSSYMKWKLVKDGAELSNGSLDYKFDTIENGRLVLTNIQEDLPDYSATQNGYHNYTFYMWFSDSCQQNDINNCAGQIDQSALIGKYFFGKIEVELYTESKKALVRKPDTTLDTSTCSYFDYAGFLRDMPVGSYVKYVGNNGCDNTNTVNGWTSCSGKNENYAYDGAWGYCSDSSSDEFTTNGWRIGYVLDGSAYLVSAGSPSCMGFCYGTLTDTTCSSGGNTTVTVHVANLNNEALKYCNEDYAKDGICDNTTARQMNDFDYQNITGNSADSCVGSSSTGCGYGNELIDTGVRYHVVGTTALFYYDGANYNALMNTGSTSSLYGIRPVLALDPSIVVVGGTGTYTDPYTIANP